MSGGLKLNNCTAATRSAATVAATATATAAAATTITTTTTAAKSSQKGTREKMIGLSIVTSALL